MNVQDLLDAGFDILNTVTDAVETGDYSHLADTVKDRTADFMGYSGQAGSNRRRSGEQDHSGESTARSEGSGGSEYAGHGRSTSRGSQENGSGRQQRPPRRNYFLQSRPDRQAGKWKRLGGLVGTVFFGGLSLLSLMNLIYYELFYGWIVFGDIFAVVFPLILAAFCALIGRRGRRQQRLVQQFYQYAELAGDKEYFSIAELAQQSGQSEDQVRRDILEMKKEGMLSYASMDRQETTVMLTGNAYGQYMEAEQSRAAREEEERRREEERRAAERAQEKSRKKENRRRKKETSKQQPEPDEEGPASSRSEESSGSARQGEAAAPKDELEELIEEGNRSIRTIREINDRISDDREMSAKLYRLEAIMKDIFERIRKEPERAKDIRRLMNYYLPTTIKLLNAYVELDAQSAAGSNVQQTKKEIEDAMDVINDAFENLLDDLFEDQAWDISSDINVMKTMMAQDGLVEDDLRTGKQ